MRTLSQEFSRTANRNRGAPSKLDELLLNSQIRVQSTTAPETSRISDGDNQQYDKDRSQNDIHPQVAISVNRSPQKVISDPDLVHHKSHFVFRHHEKIFTWHNNLKHANGVYNKHGQVLKNNQQGLVCEVFKYCETIFFMWYSIYSSSKFLGLTDVQRQI